MKHLPVFRAAAYRILACDIKPNWIFLVNAKSLEFLLLPTKKAMSWMRSTINSLRCLNQECCLEGYFF